MNHISFNNSHMSELKCQHRLKDLDHLINICIYNRLLNFLMIQNYCLQNIKGEKGGGGAPTYTFVLSPEKNV